MAPSSDGNAARNAPDRRAGALADPLVAFDFDGTLTARDSFIAFLRWRTPPLRWAFGLARLAPSALAYLLFRDRGRMKSAAVRVFLTGTPRADLEADASAFAEAAWDGLMRPDALATWAAQRADGHRLVIVTASPEEIIAPFARRLGADVLIGSRLAWTGDDRVGDGLEGPNCRGSEKVSRLRDAFGADVRLAAAYGDTSGDREMLAMAAGGGMRVFTGEPPRRDFNRASASRVRRR